MSNDFGIHRNAVGSGTEGRTQGQILSDFLAKVEDYTPTVADAVTSHVLKSSGFDAADPRIVRLIAIAAQKFVSDVANDALQNCRKRKSEASSSKNAKADKKHTMTMEDLSPALDDCGITARRAYYSV